MDRTKNNKRKQRTIHNGIVDVTDVHVAAGEAFSNWIPVARLKLKEREMKLMAIRLGICQNIIRQSIAQFTDENTRYFIDLKQKTTIRVDRMGRVNGEMFEQHLHSAALDSVMDGCGDSLSNMLNEWNGVRRLNLMQEEDMSFRKYFGICKNWFDQIKLERIAFDFWVPLFDLVDDV